MFSQTLEDHATSGSVRSVGLGDMENNYENDDA